MYLTSIFKDSSMRIQWCLLRSFLLQIYANCEFWGNISTFRMLHRDPRSFLPNDIASILPTIFLSSILESRRLLECKLDRDSRYLALLPEMSFDVQRFLWYVAYIPIGIKYAIWCNCMCIRRRPISEFNLWYNRLFFPFIHAI